MIYVNNLAVDTYQFSDKDILIKEDSAFVESLMRFNWDEIEVTLEADDCARDLYELLQVKAFLDRFVCRFKSDAKISLKILYMPAARSDRVFGDFEGFSVGTVAKVINGMNFSSVTIYDPHSDVTPALIYRSIVVSQEELILSQIPSDLLLKCTIAAPDLGAAKKIEAVCKKCHKENFIQCIKIRDLKTGNITKCDLVNPPEDVRNKDILIVDDICDGGASFIHLAKMLKEFGAHKVYLYVSHGIFSKGLSVFNNIIDGIYTYHTVGNYSSKNELNLFNRRYS